jgi:lysyl-tRNA synthetase class 2
MRREAVESTTMKSVGYESKSKVLEIEFGSGVVYQYLEVPKKVYEGLRRAESKGQYFNGEIRDEYEFVRVGARRRATAG